MSSVFDSLSGLEAKHQAWERSHETSSSTASLLKDDPDTSEEFARSEPSTFKRPWSNVPAPRKRKQNYSGTPSNIPDYKLHPDKWTKYSLEDVSENDMSEASNKSAAFEYLQERRLQNAALVTDLSGSAERDQSRHVFHKRVGDGAADAVTAPKQEASRPGKLVMPECVVGARTRPRKSVPVKRGAQRMVTSSVRFEYEDDEDEDEDLGPMDFSSTKEKTTKAKHRNLRPRCEDD